MKKYKCFTALFILLCLTPVFAVQCGDVNSNGEVDILDALLIAQFYVGQIPLKFDNSSADVDGNKAVNIVDALLVAQYYVGNIKELSACEPVSSPYPHPDLVKPRVIATTDGYIDDESSMVRFLMYASDYDIVGILQVNSKYNGSGNSEAGWIETQIDAYEKILPNLRIHHPDYPEADYLRSIVKKGNENYEDVDRDPPDMAVKNTEGAQLIIDRLLDNDPRPVHVLSWGGANTTASALYKLKTEYSKEEFEYAAKRIRIYCIWYQDGGGQWIEDNIKEAYINEAYRWNDVWDYGSTNDTVNPPLERSFMSEEWLNKNVKTGHGVLGALYSQSYVSEGDTPSFLHLINNGLLSHLDYTLGGWGGRSVYDDPINKPNHLTDSKLTEDGDSGKMYWRWLIDAQNDFEARMDYCLANSFDGANHPPKAEVLGSLTRNVNPGDNVTLDGSLTRDPDEDSLSYKWWQYYEADSCQSRVIIKNDSSLSEANFVVPKEPGKEIHIIFEVKDNGTPPLKAYRRIIFNIK